MQVGAGPADPGSPGGQSCCTTSLYSMGMTTWPPPKMMEPDLQEGVGAVLRGEGESNPTTRVVWFGAG